MQQYFTNFSIMQISTALAIVIITPNFTVNLNNIDEPKMRLIVGDTHIIPIYFSLLLPV